MQKLVFINGAGKQIDLTSGNFGITNWEGLSNTGLNIQTQQVPFQDGGVFLDALMEEREIELTVAIQDNNNLELRYQKKRELISALNPKVGEGTLIYTNDYLSRQIKAVPQIPIFENKNSNDAGTLKASVVFTCPSPYWEDVEETSVFFGIDKLPIIKNDGDVPTQLKIYFFTGNVINPTLYNMTTNKKVKFDGTLNKNLYIDTNIGQKQAYSNDIRYNIAKYCGQINKVIYIKTLSKFYAVTNNFILSSYDGDNWGQISTKINGILNNILYSEEKQMFIAVGTNGLIITSSDGNNWVSRNSGVTADLYGITYSAELDLFVVVGDSGTILTSDDVSTWNEIIKTNDLRAVTYSAEKNLFVAVGRYNAIFTSLDGENWTSRTSEDYGEWGDVIYINELDLFIVAGANRNIIIRSADGINWVTCNVEGYGGINAFAYAKELNKIVAVSQVSVKISEDGIDWVSYEIDETESSIVYSDDLNLFVAVGDESIIKSFNGIEWETVNYGNGTSFTDVVYSRKLNLFVAVGSGAILTSTDKIKWTVRLSDSQYNLSGITYSEEKEIFVAIGQTLIDSHLISYDGINWQQAPNNGSYDIYDIIYVNKFHKFYMAGGYSVDGIYFEDLTYPDPEGIKHFYGIVYSEKKNMFVTVGQNGLIYTSPDCDNWTQRVSGTSAVLESITYSDDLDLFVAVGDGVILTSSNGIDWEVKTITENLDDIIYTNILSMFSAVSDDGKILTSVDGKNWNVFDLKSSLVLKAVTYSEHQNAFVIVGFDETVIYTDFVEDINQIQNISDDSDMGLNLEIGENQFRISRTQGNFNCRLTYRQKYIGV